MSDENSLNPVELAAELTIAWLGNQNNRCTAEEVPTFLRTMHATITELSGGSNVPAEAAEETPAQAEFTPAVTVRKSLGSKDHIISLIDGKPYKGLRRGHHNAVCSPRTGEEACLTPASRPHPGRPNCLLGRLKTERRLPRSRVPHAGPNLT